MDQRTGSTAFHFACDEGDGGCVEALIRAGCDTTLRDKDGETGQDIAESCGHTALVGQLKASLRSDPAKLVLAARTGDCETVERLIASQPGLDVNALVSMSDVDEADPRNPIHEFDPRSAAHSTALLRAIGHNQGAVARLLLRHGADPNRADHSGWTPLMQASYSLELSTLSPRG